MTDADKVSIIRPTYILSNETPLFAPLSPPVDEAVDSEGTLGRFAKYTLSSFSLRFFHFLPSIHEFPVKTL